MRQLFTLLVLAAAGYLGYNYYLEHYAPKSETPPSAEQPADGTPGAPGIEVAPPPPPTTPIPFVSKIEIPAGAPGQKFFAPTGTFFMLERVSAETETGIFAAVPGEKMQLLKRNGDGTLKLVTEDRKVEFVVKESQVTNDLEAAQSAERADAALHPRRK